MRPRGGCHYPENGYCDFSTTCELSPRTLKRTLQRVLLGIRQNCGGQSVRKIVLVAGRGSLAGLKLAIGNSCLLSLDIVNCPVSPSTFVYSAEWILLKSSYFPH